MIFDTAFYEASFIKNKKAARDNTAITTYKILLALFPDFDTINEPILSMNSLRPTFIFCTRDTKRGGNGYE